ncbi:winged helix DNA-binding domain-containing protein [Microbacterium thalassium]|uniref:Winged helix DNA-binding domain-containing protein n=1 Tax=Microbacterium thalassium TaxID=362649 RepID=A0A7X0FPB9_9MICO|nr:winged helix DNA-binding domain-containing protein [Microbacterium thalassium]MBB6391224.1 hypothetical protein [Microbacterium thalassium]GLK23665.1 hypothetical protein GCM10017607_09830 [Microbacterium thalassium]
MDRRRLRHARLRAHRLSAPAASVADAAQRMLAVQAQDFRGGRWALGVRTRGTATIAQVDAAFDRGDIVRSWTMRGTLHIAPARDLSWILDVTAERQFRAAAAPRRREGIDEDDLVRAERVVRSALRGGGRLTRAELFALLDGGGVPTQGQRGYHVLTSLSLRRVVVQGPVVERGGALSREQHIVLFDDWTADAASPDDPVAELFARYIAGHGPATAADFAWWAALPIGAARQAAEAAADAVEQVPGEGEPRFVSASAPPRRSAAASRVIALPPFDEYYLSYADRTGVCDAELLDRVGPGKNGMVAAVLLADGDVVGRWTHAAALAGRRDEPAGRLFAPDAATPDEVDAALARYRAFVTV